MAIPVRSVMDFNNRNLVTNLAPAVAAGQPVTFEQLNAAIEGLAWKDNVRVATQANINLASPGATVDGVTMAANDRMLVRAQTTAAENGIYIWNGAATPATRSLDASTWAELLSAVTSADEGTSAAVTFRQTAVTGTLESTAIGWSVFGASAPAANETTAGILEVATQSETDTGTDDARAVTPLKLANWSGRKRKNVATIGDGTATSYTVTHNFNMRSVDVAARENSGSYRKIWVEDRAVSTNAIELVFDQAPASNSVEITILG